MSLKRKRSGCAMVSSNPTISPPPRCNNDMYMINYDSIAFHHHHHHPSSDIAQLHSYASPSHLHSRTRKRFRSKPDESSMRQKTYDILFAAAAAAAATSCSSPSLTSTPSPTTYPQPLPGLQSQSKSQPSLHTFWSLPHPPPTTPSSNNHIPSAAVRQQQQQQQPTCQDCDSLLLPSSSLAADTAMSADIWMGGTDPELMMDRVAEFFGCGSCGRQVCDVCAVVESGRECLGCRIERGRGRRGDGWVGKMMGLVL